MGLYKTFQRFRKVGQNGNWTKICRGSWVRDFTEGLNKGLLPHLRKSGVLKGEVVNVEQGGKDDGKGKLNEFDRNAIHPYGIGSGFGY